MSTLQISNRTTHEKMLEPVFKELGIKYEINQNYCFLCKGHFTWPYKCYPPKCDVGNHIIDGNSGGTYCRPDYIIRYGKGNKKIAVVEVNGGIHDRYHEKKKFCNKISSLLNQKVKVFIILNQEIEQFSRHELDETVKYWVRCMKNNKWYKEYVNSNQFKEHSCLYMLPGFSYD